MIKFAGREVHIEDMCMQILNYLLFYLFYSTFVLMPIRKDQLNFLFGGR